VEIREIATPQWEGRSVAELTARWGASAVHLFEELGSTSDVARRLASAGAPAGTVVLGERQTQGRGRAGRRWESPGGAGLWLSIIVRAGADAATLPILVGHLVAGCIDPWIAPATAGLKWPNDVLLGERKVGGILCEGSWNGVNAATVIVGIGVNVRDLPPELDQAVREGATSLAEHATRPVDRATLAECVVRSVLVRVREPLALTPSELEALAGRDALRGRAVRISEPTSGEPLHEGTAIGIGPDGTLLLRDDDGVLRRIHSGTVRLV
jgi:BirA family transcriptional regulator, biotin operon repressor / biotin---[acetyl-CoA-carboxylase] ligase